MDPVTSKLLNTDMITTFIKTADILTQKQITFLQNMHELSYFVLNSFKWIKTVIELPAVD